MFAQQAARRSPSNLLKQKHETADWAKGPLYKSGDLVRRLPDGNIEFLGRIDFQVKIRGFRIELGEIENRLLKHGAVKEAVVSALGEERQDKYLCAYVVPAADDALDTGQLEEYLTGFLPPYMVPSYFVQLERVPLTAAGKPDRKVLPLPDRGAAGERYAPPRDRVERALVEIWAGVLDLDASVIGIDDDFFKLGGHSLRATTAAARVHKTLQVTLPLVEMFKNPRIRELAGFIKAGIGESGSALAYADIEPVEKKEYYPASPAQRRLYILHRMETGGTSYNMPALFPLPEETGPRQLEEAFKKLIQRHESLRTSFHLVDDEPVQVVHDHADFSIEHAPIPRESHTSAPLSHTGQSSSSLPTTYHLPLTAFTRPFELSRAPLLRVTLLGGEEANRWMLVDMHHIISDGVSHDVLERDFTALLRGEELPGLRLQYKDFAQWQGQDAQKERILGQERYWLEVFGGEPPVLQLPTDYPRPRVQSFEGASVSFQLEPAVTDRLKETAGAGGTMFMVLLAAFNLLLAKLGGSDDIIVGTPVAGRRHADLENIIGMFVNTLALRTGPAGGKTFENYLGEVRNHCLEAFENQDYPFDLLVEQVDVERDASRNPLFDVFFSFNSFAGKKNASMLSPSDGVESPAASMGTEIQTAKFDLTLTVQEAEDRLYLNMQYCTRLFRARTIERFSVYFHRLAAGVLSNPGQELCEIDMLPEEEKKQLLVDFNDTRCEFPQDKTLHLLFQEQAPRSPDLTALYGPPARGGDMVRVSYRQLDDLSGRLAFQLRILGLLPGDIAALELERSLEMVVAVLAILKAGAAYLPIAPDTPDQRIRYMLADSNAAIILSNRPPLEKDRELRDGGVYYLEWDKILELEAPPAEELCGTSLGSRSPAYVIYTSGSTGKPKGVMVEHFSAVNLITALSNRYPPGVEDAYLFKTSYIFDVSVSELFGWCLGAGRLVIAPEGHHKEPRLLMDLIGRFGITHINFVPSMFHAFLDFLTPENIGQLSPLKYIFLAGEALPAYQVEGFRRLGTGIRLENLYGPTEVTVYSSWYSLEEWKGGGVPIGKPLPNLQLHILGGNLELLPLGVAGELCITGAGVARGYLNRPELTAEKFIFPGPLYRSGPLYRTGDLCRRLPEGNIEFLGRIDFQVKIRGFRIELGEIESYLLNYHGVKEAVVIDRVEGEGEKYLCAYFVPGGEVTGQQLREYLSRLLPDYMVPAFIVELPEIPLNPNGKVDRKALPKPDAAEAGGYEAPADDLEKKLISIWSEVLGLDEGMIGATSGFFKLGGHSLKATVMVGKIHQQLGIRVPLAEIFLRTSVRQLAVYIRDQRKEQYVSIPPGEDREYYPLSPAQKRMFLLQQMLPGGTVYNVPQAVPLREDVEPDRLETVFLQLLRRHESLRTSFHTVDGEPVQRIHPPETYEFEFERHIPGKVPPAADLSSPSTLDSQLPSAFIRPFELSRPPLLRVGMTSARDGAAVLLLDMHHIITDAVSQHVLIREFHALYSGEKLSPPRLQYKDYALWQKSGLERERIRRQEAYWMDVFRDEVPVMELPADYPRPRARSFEGAVVQFGLSADETRRIKIAAGEAGVTLFMYLFTAYVLLLWKLSGGEDIVVGIPTANRRHADIEQLIGLFVNTLALRQSIRAEASITDYLPDIKETVLNAFENQEYPFEELVEKVPVQRDAGRNPLFDTMFNLLESGESSGAVPSLEENKDLFRHRPGTARFDLLLGGMDCGDWLSFYFEYGTSLFKPDTIDGYIVYLRRLLRFLCERPHARLRDIDILSQEEKQRVVMDFNRTSTEYPRDKTIFALFEEVAAAMPDRTALSALSSQPSTSGERVQLTYRELRECSLRSAALLREKGVECGDIVAIMTSRSLETVAALLAILGLGGSYLPINPDYPPGRIDYMLADSCAGVLVSAPGISFPRGVVESRGVETVVLEPGVFRSGAPAPMGETTGRTTSSRELAYILYTSGTTGRPKAVAVEHRGVVRLVKNTDYICFRPGDRILQTGAMEFDASTFEMWGSLLNGLTLYEADRPVLLVTENLKAFLYREDIGILWMTSAWFNQVVETDVHVFGGLHHLLVGGDVVSPIHVRRVIEHYPGLSVINGYGPTENTTFSTTHLIEDAGVDQIPIGRPIANSTVYIVDPFGHPVPVGVPGELWAGGDGIARGYLNRPELTAEKFVLPGGRGPVAEGEKNKKGDRQEIFSPSPLSPSHLYRTGDLARWLPDGNVQFLGRIDFQVKIRGFRVEPGEIENHLLNHRLVKEAVVIDRREGQGEKYLCAYVVTRGEVTVEQLKTYLSGRMADYMVPAFIVELPGIPLNSNGKVDRKALPVPGRGAGGESYTAPRDRVETRLAEIWAGVLGLDASDIGIDDDFFNLGGHSLLATTVVARVHKAFNVKLPMVEMFKTPRIRQLSEFIKARAGDSVVRYTGIEPVEKREYYVTSPAQRRLYILHRMEVDGTAYNMPEAYPLTRAPELDRLEKVFKQLIHRHESLRTSFFMVEDDPVQRIHDSVDFSIEAPVLTSGSTASHQDLSPGFLRPFDLSRPPLLRVRLISSAAAPEASVDLPSPAPHLLLIDMHHIISDGISQVVLQRDFAALYQEESLPPLRLHYKDFASWRDSRAEWERIRRQEQYWLRKFSGETPVLQLPTDFNRPMRQTYEGARLFFDCEPGDASMLKQTASRHGASLFMVLMAVYNVFLARMSGQEDIVVGTPMAGRLHADLEDIIGMFVLTLALRNFPTAEHPFGQLLGEVKDHTLEAFDNQEYPFEELVEKVCDRREANRNPLFDVMFSMPNMAPPTGEPPGTGAGEKPPELYSSAKFDLTLTVVEMAAAPRFFFQYSTALFKESTIRRFMGYFNTLLRQCLRQPELPISYMEIVSGEEKQRLLEEFNAAADPIPGKLTIKSWFEEQVRRTPEHIAVKGPAGTAGAAEAGAAYTSLTYRELNEAANLWARFLVEKGLAPGTLAGLMVEPHLLMVVGLLAIIKAGAAYLPLESTFPPGRISYMLKDADVRLLLTPAAPPPGVEFDGQVVYLRQESPGTGEVGDLPTPVQPGDVLYTIYTSGSTGLPKGVALTHENLVNYSRWFSGFAGVGDTTRTMLTSSFAFDLGYTNFYPCILNGGRFHLPVKDVYLNPALFWEYVRENGITHLKMTPSLFAPLVESLDFTSGACASVRVVVLGGEAIIPRDVARAYAVSPGLRIINHYGPTETTIGSVAQFIAPEELETYMETPTIGYPIANTRVHIMENGRTLAPPGGVGELCIGGKGVARGYLNQPGLTVERFIADPYAPGDRLYRTGDLVRRLENGKIQFLGRIDHQVKIRGYRIEIGEIEKALSLHENVKDVVVIAREETGGAKYLCAYTVPAARGESETGGGIPDLKEFLSRRLPDYMVPAFFVELPEIPLNPNGKVDRKALPKPDASGGDDYEPPADDLEKQLVSIWAEVLELDEGMFGVESNFFSLGGHSLKATVMVGKIHKLLDVRVPLAEIFLHSTVRKLAGYIREQEKERYVSIPTAEEREYYPLSSAQRRLYILQQMEPEGTAYNMPKIAPLRSTVGRKQLEDIIRRLMLLHESLRTSFHILESHPVQCIHPPGSLDVAIEYYTPEALSLSPGSSPFPASFIRSFDLSRAPLLRIGVAENSEGRQFLLVDMHHIISDGVSHGILVDDFSALQQGREPAPTRLRYRDYALWETGALEKGALKAEGDWWLKEFSGDLPVLSLPTDYPRPAIRSFAGASINFSVDADVAGKIQALVLQEGASLFMVLTALFNILVFRLSGSEDIVIGAPIAGRRIPELSGIIGMFVNTLALRNFPRPDMAFNDFFHQVKERSLSAFENQDYPFDHLVEQVSVERDAGRNPLFDIMFAYYGEDSAAGRSGGGNGTPGAPENLPEEMTEGEGVAKFDLTLSALEAGGNLHFNFQYCTRLFKPGTIRRFAGYFRKILAAAVSDPGQRLGDIDMLPEQEKHRLLVEFNDIHREYPAGKTVYRWFEEQAQRTPDRMALKGGDGEGRLQLTYRALNDRCNRLARTLRREGAGSNRVVGVLLERSVDIAVAILAVLKAGGAYLPIDTQNPPERIQYMLEQGGVPLLLSNSRHLEKGEQSCTVVDVEAETSYDSKAGNLEPLSGPNDMIYVIFTSGSTGRPKGAGVYHRGFINLVHWYVTEFELGVDDRVLLMTSLSFDLTQKNLYAPLVSGGTLNLAAGRYFDPLVIRETVGREHITYINCTPSMSYRLVEEEESFEWLSPLRYVFLGGEPIALLNLKLWLESPLCRARVINTYGPTECTDVCAYYPIEEPARFWDMPVPTGGPVQNTRMYVLDKALNPVPLGVAGELCVSGDGVGAGYINDETLTAEKFVIPAGDWYRADSASSPPPLYKTGDLARWLPDGNIRFLGRIDFQVKIRGFRIELGEIESHLLNHEAVKEAVVIDRREGDGEKYLCAYVVPDGDVTGEQLKSYLSGRLPDYMVPAFFVELAEIPLNPNGKVDRKALPKPGASAAGAYEPPADELEKQLVSIWSGVLGLDEGMFGVESNFFSLGGHSLKATVMVGKIHKQLEVRVPLAEIFVHSTVRKLAGYIREQEKERYVSIPLGEERDYYPLSSAQRRLFILQQMEPEGTAYNMPEMVPLHPPVERDRLEDIIRRLIQHHEGLRTSFHMLDGAPVQCIHPPDSVDVTIEHHTPEPPPSAPDSSPLPTTYDLLPGNLKSIENSNAPFLDSIKEPGKIKPVRDGLPTAFIRSFDLSRSPLLRIGLVEHGEGKQFLLVDMHHIISDGVSHAILVKDFNALRDGREPTQSRLRYRDYALWESGALEQGSLKAQGDWWLKEFSGELPVLNLPTDFPRPAVQSFEGASMGFSLDAATAAKIRALAVEEGASLFMVLAALFNVLLFRLSGSEDIVIGAPIAGRRNIELADIIGMFVNTLALRNFPTGGISFSDFFREVKERALEAFENQDYPFDHLVERVEVQRDAGRNPLFDVMFAYNGGGEETAPGAGMPALPAESHQEITGAGAVAKFDLTFAAEETNGPLMFSFQYCIRLFTAETIKRFAGYFRRLTALVVDGPGRELCALDILSPREKQQLLADFNDTGQPYPSLETIHGLFERQVEAVPGNIALVDSPEGGERLTYRQLNRRANQLAYYLRQRGVAEGDRVGILVERRAAMITGILGILKAGCAYVPLNPKGPARRSRFILEECRASVVLTCPGLSSASHPPGDYTYLDIDDTAAYSSAPAPEPPLEVSPRSYAYVIFTSGTTGMPKGVPITHANFSPLIHWGYRHLGIGPSGRVFQNLSYYFDWSVWEIFIALTTGASLYMVPEEVQLNPAAGIDFIWEHQITVLHATPTQYGYYINTGRKLDTLTHLFIGAEKLPLELVRRSFDSVGEQCRVFNMYGPTEATIIAAVQEIRRGCEEGYRHLGSVPIGVPVGNTSLLILDKYRQPCPLSVVGELYIGGEGLSSGYLNSPELTAERFVNYNIQIPNHKQITNSKSQTKKGAGQEEFLLYSTGDLARWLPDGTVEFFGRADHQVKVRGFRIELGEIESQIRRHEAVKETVVLALDGDRGEKYLCAYLVPGNGIDGVPGLESLTEFLVPSLPDYMIPSYVVPIERIPLNPNGKIDLKALPAPDVTAEKELIAPSGDIETRLAAIWAEVLGLPVENIGAGGNFFHLGGHSLKATIMAGKIHRDFDVNIPLAEIFLHPTVRELGGRIESARAENTGTSSFTSIPIVEEREYYPLSSAQQRLYILQRMEPHGVVYNIPQAVPLSPPMEVETLEHIFRRLIQRHESLRTSFHMLDGRPVQRIHPPEEIDFSIQRHTPELPPAAPGASPLPTTYDILPTAFIRPFDLSEAPLMRVGVVASGGEARLLLVDIHHIISDGESNRVLVDDFAALRAGKTLEPPAVRYRDYAVWQQTGLEQEALKQQEQWWLELLRGELPVLDLPADYPRPAVQSFEGASLEFPLPPGTSTALYALARSGDASPFMLLIALFKVLLFKLGGLEDTIVGTPVAGRRHADVQQIMGMFVNTLALRTRPVGTKTFAQYLHEVRSHCLEAFENQDYPFDHLVEQVAVERDAGRNPLFDVMFTFTGANGPGEPGGATGDETRNQPEPDGTPGSEKQVAKFDLTFSAVETGNRLLLGMQYCTRLFDKETVRTFSRYFLSVVSAVLENPGQRLYELDMLPDEEKRQLLLDFNDTGEPYPNHKTIHGLFERCVETGGTGTALVDGRDGRSLTYRELDRCANRLAHYLINRGVNPGDRVGILADRRAEMITGILAILKAGCAYVPLNPSGPAQRSRFILEECGTPVVLTLSGLPAHSRPPGDYSYVLIDDDRLYAPMPETAPLPGDCSQGIAYIIFTSGTTGMPKGVPITHANFSPLIHWGFRHLGIGPSDRVFQNLSYYFDWSVWEIFIALTTGASLYMVPEEVQLNPDAGIDFIAEHQITVLHATPTQYGYYANTGRKLETLTHLFLGAEKLTLDLVRRSFGSVNEHCRVFNMYGPTEATIIASVLEIQRGAEERYRYLGSIPIGVPVGNTSLFVLDKYQRPCPLKVVGELYIGGEGLSRGYLNSPELTAERFVNYNIQIPNHKQITNSKSQTKKGDRQEEFLLYSTGDLARWLPDGTVEFFGRIDHQVKVRGFRIELGEIESQLLRHETIKETVVLALDDDRGEKYLCAYVVPAGGAGNAPGLAELKEFLAPSLPDYMVPAHVVPIDAIPLNPNGKIDLKALPRPEIQAGEDYIPPRDEVEHRLLEIMCGVLGITGKAVSVGVRDNFFNLGGNSLLATVLVSEIQKEFGLQIPLVEVFTSPTAESMARCIKARPASGDTGERLLAGLPRNLVRLGAAAAEAPNLFLVHDGSGEVEAYVQLCRGLGDGFNGWGVRAEPFRDNAPRNLEIETLGLRYIETIKKLQPRGPYALAGWSLGGTIAFEMVRQLEAMGDKVDFLAMIDAVPPMPQPAPVEPFSCETELPWLEKLVEDEDFFERLTRQPDLPSLWKLLVEQLERTGPDERLKERFFPPGLLLGIPNHERLPVSRLVYYSNLSRSLLRARANYIPQSKVNAPVFHFTAAGAAEDRKAWDLYLQRPSHMYEMDGEHYRLLSMPHAAWLAGEFKKLPGVF